jgi:hypothetical protein
VEAADAAGDFQAGLGCPSGEVECGTCLEEARARDVWGLGFEAEGVFLDDGVDEDLAGDAFDFGGGLGFGEIVEGEEEVFPLADVLDSLVVHAAEGLGDGLALGVEHGAFEGDEDVGFHGLDYKVREGRMRRKEL